MEYDDVTEIALEQMEKQRMIPGDRRKYLCQYFGFSAIEASVIIQNQVFEMEQIYE